LFSSELAEREIVVQYVSDGLQAELTESEITVHKTYTLLIGCTTLVFLTVETFQTEVKRALDRYKKTTFIKLKWIGRILICK
jgi:hypothetical protein